MTNDQLSVKWRRGKASEDKENDKEEEEKGEEDKSAYCVQGMANEAEWWQEALAGTPQPCSQIP